MGAGTPKTREGRGAEGCGGSLRLRLPNSPAFLGLVRDVAAGAAALASFDASASSYVARVSGSLAARLMDPALDPPEDGFVEVDLHLTGRALEVTVRDGPPFDPAQGGRAEQSAHGLLASGSSDWIASTNKGRAGRELRVLLHRPDAEAAVEEPSAPPDDGHSLVVCASEPCGI